MTTITKANTGTWGDEHQMVDIQHIFWGKVLEWFPGGFGFSPHFSAALGLGLGQNLP